MEMLKIAITQTGNDEKSRELILRALEDPAISELCTPIVQEKEAALRDLEKGDVDALVLAQTESAKCPAGAIRILVTEKATLMPLEAEPTAEDVIRLRDILERDFDCRSPRIVIVQETGMQNPDLATQVTAEQGINTYGPYTAEQFFANDMALHFDGIITAEKPSAQRILEELSQEVPVCFFAGKETVVTAACRPLHMDETGNELEDVSCLTHPIYTAIDIIRNRAFYDEARQNPLPKLFRDKREERKAEKETPKSSE